MYLQEKVADFYNCIFISSVLPSKENNQEKNKSAPSATSYAQINSVEFI